MNYTSFYFLNEKELAELLAYKQYVYFCHKGDAAPVMYWREEAEGIWSVSLHERPDCNVTVRSDQHVDKPTGYSTKFNAIPIHHGTVKEVADMLVRRSPQYGSINDVAYVDFLGVRGFITDSTMRSLAKVKVLEMYEIASAYSTVSITRTFPDYSQILTSNEEESTIFHAHFMFTHDIHEALFHASTHSRGVWATKLMENQGIPFCSRTQYQLWNFGDLYFITYNDLDISKLFEGTEFRRVPVNYDPALDEKRWIRELKTDAYVVIGKPEDLERPVNRSLELGKKVSQAFVHRDTFVTKSGLGILTRATGIGKLLVNYLAAKQLTHRTKVEDMVRGR